MKKNFEFNLWDILKLKDVVFNGLPFIIIVMFLFEGFYGLSESMRTEDFADNDCIIAAGDEFEIPTILTLNDSEQLFDFEIVARWIGCGLATAGLGGVGTGIGMVFSGLIEGLSRNPSVKDDLFNYAIFGFALTEAIGLFSLMIAFMLLYA